MDLELLTVKSVVLRRVLGTLQALYKYLIIWIKNLGNMESKDIDAAQKL